MTTGALKLELIKEQDLFSVSCISCMDTGYVQSRDNRLIPCRTCNKVFRDRLEVYLKMSLHHPKTIDTFDAPPSVGATVYVGVKAAREAAQAFVNAALNNAQGGWLYIFGPPLSGKTHLAAGIFNALCEHEFPALFVKESQFFTRGKNSHLLEAALEVPVLIVDEFGSSYTNSEIELARHRIVVDRYESHLPTVFASIHKPDSFPPQIAARLTDRRFTYLITLPSVASN